MSTQNNNIRSVNLDELKKIQLKILKYVDDYCLEHDIKYFLMYGSLIGAIRHGGVIPWDDDIDICMTREEYDRFLLSFPANQSAPFFVRSQTTDSCFPFYYAKICVKGTHAFEPIDGKDYDVGINIDLFPLDSIPDNVFVRIIQKLYIKLYRAKLLPHTIDLNKKRSMYKRAVISVLKTIYRKPAYYYIAHIRKCTAINDRKKFKKVTEIMTPYGKRAVFPREWFEKVIRRTFEDLTVSIPCEYDLILSQLYGDYMTPPPIDKRSSHHSFQAYIDCDCEHTLLK